MLATKQRRFARRRCLGLVGLLGDAHRHKNQNNSICNIQIIAHNEDSRLTIIEIFKLIFDMCETYSDYVRLHIFPSWIQKQRCPEVLLGWDPSDFEKLTEASRRDPLLGGSMLSVCAYDSIYILYIYNYIYILNTLYI